MLAIGAGIIAGIFVFLSLVRWAALVFEAWQQTTLLEGRFARGRFAQMLVCESLFHSAPWLVLTCAFFFWSIRHESWAGWFYGGFVLVIAQMAWVTLRTFRLLRARKEAGATPAH